MILHIALTINDLKEIKNFYEDVLLFNIQGKFSIDKEISRKIFNIESSSDVCMMRYHDIYFEIFISPKKEKRVFSHICLAYRNTEIIYKKAIELGFKAFIKKNSGSNTYFIWDRSGNMFEIKEIVENK